ncbi:uncharacterized protein LOC143146110 [Ptiloglossa arizonensis]|uniref:uncharacterized protein LOC143146110 n=1 Tax=Ptiloglossa arizonensis TaxID=3350558 RepID=UPI003FA006F6
MCDHCSKVTSQKGYTGQVTCKCEHGEKKSTEGKDKDYGGCCSKKEKKATGGCCGSKCCSGTQEEGGCCISGATSKEAKHCCPQDK